MRPRFLLPAFLVALTTWGFHEVLSQGFVLWDDNVLIYENPHLRSLSAGDLLPVWRAQYAGMYMPLTYTLWACLANTYRAIAGEQGLLTAGPFFHGLSLVLHLASVLLAFALLKELVRNEWAAAAGALLFAIHPCQVESVAWASATKDVLCGCLSLAALQQYLVALNRDSDTAAGGRRVVNQLGAFVLFVLALLAKPAAVALPVVAWILGGIHPGRCPRRRGLPLALWLLVAVGFALVANCSTRAVSEIPNTSLPSRTLIAADALGHYAVKLAMPLRLCPDYGRTPERVLKNWRTSPLWLLAVFLVGGLVASARGHPRRLIPPAMFAAGVLPVLGLVPFAFQQVSTVADRYTYVALLGPALGLAWAVSRWRARAWVACVPLLLLLLLQTRYQTAVWADTESLFEHTLQVNPRSWVAHNNLGVFYGQAGQLEAAYQHYAAAVRLKPTDAISHNNLAVLLSELGARDEALSHFQAAVNLCPQYVDARYSLACLLAERGDVKAAAREFAEVVRLQPQHGDAHYNLAVAAEKLGDLDSAVAHYQACLRLQPQRVAARRQLQRLQEQRRGVRKPNSHGSN